MKCNIHRITLKTAIPIKLSKSLILPNYGKDYNFCSTM